MISHLDQQVGKVIGYFTQHDLRKDNIVVYAADNGLSLGCHGLMGKQNTYEESVRVPLIFAGADIPQGKQEQGYVYLLDIFPTLCEMMGWKIPDSVEGESFFKAFTETVWNGRESLYFACNDMIRALKEKRYKLIEYRGKRPHAQLFDLEKDPWERYDLSDILPDEVKRMRKELQEYAAKWENAGHMYSKAFWNRF